ncbi:MAG: hypothetical protein WC405_17505 [Syntrophales bacterium]
MPTVSLTSNKYFSLARQAYHRLRDEAPSVKPACRAIHQYYRQAGTTDEVYRDAAKVFSCCRDLTGSMTSTLFVQYYHDRLQIGIRSASGDFEDSLQYGALVPSSFHAFAIIEQKSVHIPDLWQVGEMECQPIMPTEIVTEESREIELYYPIKAYNLFPLDFWRTQGAMLVTPLGIGLRPAFGLGCVVEYQASGPFSLTAIKEARALAASFTMEILSRIQPGAIEFYNGRLFP